MKVSIAFFVLSACSATQAQQPTKPSVEHENWSIRWSVSDEFNGNSPDWKKWILSGNLPDTSSWLWRNSENVRIDEGFARLSLRHNDGNKPERGTYFTSAILKSYNTFQYGFFEARIRGAAFPGSGVCPSFWLFSDFDDGAAEGQTIYSEVDVVELQQYDWHEGIQDDARVLDLNLHCVIAKEGKREWRRPKAFPETQLNKWTAPWDPRDAFHVYGCEVGPEEIAWYIDGIEVARKPNTHWHRPKHVAVSLGLRKPFVEFDSNRNNSLDPMENDEARAKLPELPTSMVVDYVRVWERSP